MTEAEFKNSEFYTECLAEYKALSKEELIDKLIKESWYVCELEDDADALCCANILIDRLEEKNRIPRVCVRPLLPRTNRGRYSSFM